MIKTKKTAEVVTPMHPDKICDRIADAILDACLEQDPMSRVAVEVMGSHGIITIGGEITTKAYVNTHEVVRKIVGEKYGIQVNIVQQSPEIAGGVDTGGAGDQGIMIGYACNENEAMIPNELYLARSLAQFIFLSHPYDGKTQISLDEEGNVEAIVASFQCVGKQTLYDEVIAWMDAEQKATNKILAKVLPKIYTNPAGDWNIGGFEADTGVTGRKLAVDQYGPQIPIGGGAFSGKDATKVDRSAAYMARKIAVDLLRAYVSQGATEVMVKLAYAIGVAHPVMATAVIQLTDPAGGACTEKVVNLLEKHFENPDMLTPKNIISLLDLRTPQFEETARWGHFGHGFNWEKQQ